MSNGDWQNSNGTHEQDERKEAPHDQAAAASDSISGPEIDDNPLRPQPSGSLRVLPKRDAHLLSADQLLTGPSSFVRELLENALDSGARLVQVLIGQSQDGAINSIEVRDNGCGINKEDRKVVGQAHATSKIRSFDDIVFAGVGGDGTGSSNGGVRSFGFRGEALHCLIHMSKAFTLTTKHATDTIATRMTWLEGKRQQKEDRLAMQGTGTTVRASGLFFSRPVRMERLKKASVVRAEMEALAEMLRGYALIYPQVRIICNKPSFTKPALSPSSSSPPSSTDAASSLHGLELLRKSIPLMVGGSASVLNSMMSLEAESEGFKIEGFITRHDADPNNKELIRGHGDRIYFILPPHRFLTLPWLSKVLVAEWRSRGMRQLQRQRMREARVEVPSSSSSSSEKPVIDPAIEGAFTSRFPLLVMFIHVPSPASMVDLNRSPDKRDILIGDELTFKRNIIQCANNAIKRAFEEIERKEREKEQERRANMQKMQETHQQQQQHPFHNEESTAQSGAGMARPLGAALSPASAASSVSAIAGSAAQPVPMSDAGSHHHHHGDVAGHIDEDTDEVEIVPTPPSFKSSQPPPSQPRAVPSGTIDFSHFARPLPQPQSFQHPPSPPASTAQRTGSSPSIPSLPPIGQQQQSSPIAHRYPSAVSPPPKKRPRVSTGSSHSDSTSSSPSAASIPMRQTQLTVVDAVNTQFLLSDRIIDFVDNDWDQLMDQFEKQIRFDPDQEEEKEESSCVEGQPIGRLHDKDLWIICGERGRSSTPTASSPSSLPIHQLPSLRLLSPARCDEAILFHRLLVSYPIPSCPLDSPIPIDANFPFLSAEERERLLQHVSRATEQEAKPHECIPDGCYSFLKALELCGFQMQLESTPTNGDDDAAAAAATATTTTASTERLVLYSVPSNASITVEDLLATIRKIWSDACFNKYALLRVRKANQCTVNDDPSSASSNVTATLRQLSSDVEEFMPNTDWRVAGIRATIIQQAVSTIRKQQHTAALKTGQSTSMQGSNAPSHAALYTSSQVQQLIDRLRRQVKDGIVCGTPSSWLNVTCPHQKPVSLPLSFQPLL